MARFNEILAGRYNRFLQKFLSMKGGPPAPQLASELAGVWSLFHGSENRYLEGWNLYGTRVQQAAVAAQFGQFRLRNPAGSNVVAVIHKLWFLEPGAADSPFFSIAPGLGDLANPASGTFRFDARVIPNPSVSLSTGTSAAAPAVLNFQAAVALNSTLDVILEENQEIPILPGDSITLQANTVNVTFTCGMWWRERALEESERA